jgi:16S rRNA (cytosine967-C5)-methyltransferase
LEREENEENVAWFLDRHREFQLDRETPHPLCAEGWVQIFPDQYHSDGFFIARLKKRTSGD